MTADCVALSQLFRIGSSKRVLKSQWKPEGVPFYRGREISRLSFDGFVENELFISESHYAELTEKYGAPVPGDIMITAIGTIGNSYVVRDSDRFYFKDASVLWMSRTSEVNSDFVNLWLKSPQFLTQLEAGNGATVDTLTIQKLQNVKIKVPSTKEQLRIVALLDEAFAGIATAKANAEKSLRCAREAFEASLTVALGSKGWPERRLGDVCEIARGGSPRPIKAFLTNASDGVNWVKIGDASASSKYIYRTREKIKPTGVSRSRLVHSGDFLLSNSMSFGRPYIMRTSGCIHDGWLVLSKYEDSFDQDFLYLLLGSHFMYQQFDRLAAGSTVRNLNIELASRVSVPVPPLATQKQIARELEAIQDEVSHLESLYTRKVAALDELKQSLLQRAFSGQL